MSARVAASFRENSRQTAPTSKAITCTLRLELQTPSPRSPRRGNEYEGVDYVPDAVDQWNFVGHEFDDEHKQRTPITHQVVTTSSRRQFQSQNDLNNPSVATVA